VQPRITVSTSARFSGSQIEAAQAALNKIALGLVDDHVRHCMRGGKGASEEQVQELMGAVGRLVSS
jgi:DNA-binding FrmR family transcriptional regulator